MMSISQRVEGKCFLSCRETDANMILSHNYRLTTRRLRECITHGIQYISLGRSPVLGEATALKHVYVAQDSFYFY